MAENTYEVDVKAKVEGQKEIDDLGKSIEGLGTKSTSAAKGSREISKTLREARQEGKATSDSIREASTRLEEYKKVTQQHVFFSREARDAQAKLRAEITKAQQKYDQAKASTAQAAAALEQYRASAGASAGTVARLENTLAKARKELDAQRASLSSLKTETAAHTGGIQSAVSGLKSWASGAGATALAVGGLAMGVSAAGSAFREASDKAIQYKAATQALQFSLDAAKASTMGLVNSYDLTIAANRAAQTGVATTEERFAMLAGAATRLGLAMGRDAKESVNDLIGALATNSTEVLDNLGITLKVAQAQELYAEKLGKTTSELTDQEKAQAFAIIGAEKAVEAADKLNLKLSDQDLLVSQAAAKWDDFTLKLQEGATVIAAGVIASFEGLGNAIGDAMASVTSIGDEMESATQKARRLAFVAQRDAEDRVSQLASIAEQMHSLGMEMKDLGGIDLSNLDKAQAAIDQYKEGMFVESEPLGPSKADWEAEKELAKQRKQAAAEAKRRKAEADRRSKEGEKLAKVGQARVFTMEEDPSGLQESLDKRYGLLEAEIAREQSLIDMQLQGYEEGTSQYLSLIDQQAAADQRLIDLKKEQTSDKIELYNLETESLRIEEERRAAHREAMALRAKKLEEEEKKRQQEKAKVYDAASREVATSVAQVALAQKQGSETMGQAMARELSAVARSFQQRLTIYAVEQGVKALIAAASYNYPGAALHTAAAVAAGAGAVTVGRIAGALEGSVASASAPEVQAPSSTSGAGTSEQAGPSGEGSKGLDVPVSRDPITSGLKTVPQRPVTVTVVLEGPVFAQDKETVGRWIKDAVAAAEGYGGL